MPPVCRQEMSDFECSIIQPLLPNKPCGVPWGDDRKVINGIFRRPRTGSARHQIPKRYGSYTTCCKCFVRWREKGLWVRIFDAVCKAFAGKIQIIDSTSVRVHQRVANGKKAKNKTVPKPLLPPSGTKLTPDAHNTDLWGVRTAD
jgi:transposase